MNRSDRDPRSRAVEAAPDRDGAESMREKERSAPRCEGGRLPGEMADAMASGSGDEGDLSIPDPAPTDLTPAEARQVLTAPIPDEIDAEAPYDAPDG